MLIYLLCHLFSSYFGFAEVQTLLILTNFKKKAKHTQKY